MEPNGRSRVDAAAQVQHAEADTTAAELLGEASMFYVDVPAGPVS